MVKLLLNKFVKRLADKDHTCNKCEQIILKGSHYYKHISKNNKTCLHSVCYAVLSFKAIKENVSNIEGVNNA